MIKEFDYRFDELAVDRQKIMEVLGYPDGILPEPFNQYLAEAFNEAYSLSDIRATYCIINDIKIDQNEKVLSVEGLEFKVGRTICMELKGSEQLAFFVCSAGKTISEKSADLFTSKDPIQGYIYDLLGSAIVEAVGDLMQSTIKQEVGEFGGGITNRFSPGYCHWRVDDQHKLFSLFGNAPSGVTLTSSALMNPVKSISGVIGIGKNVKYKDYHCRLCKSKDCIYRRVLVR